MDAISAGPVRNANDATASLVQTADEEPLSQSKCWTPLDMWSWFAADPCSRWPWLLFFIGLIFGCIMCALASTDYKKIYVPGGVAALVLCWFGVYHFKQLMALIEQVNNYQKLNEEFKQENVQLMKQVKRLDQATQDLVGSKHTLHEANTRSKDNLKKFDKLQSNLAVMGENSVSGMNRVAQMAAGMLDKWEKQLVQSRRQVFTAVFDEMEFRENQEGMDRSEYQQFLEALPPAYAKHIERQMTFNTLAGEDGVVDIEEFGRCLDAMENESVNLSDVVVQENNTNDIPMTEVDANE